MNRIQTITINILFARCENKKQTSVIAGRFEMSMLINETCFSLCFVRFFIGWTGIMTLSRSPYSELDKMSLFQDLKLKRRKVDSRCSSDGESLADTNASSPDLIVPLSPKMCDHGGSVTSQQQQLHNNQQSHAKNARNSVSPATLDNDYNSTSTDSTGKSNQKTRTPVQ